ncbi:MAG: cold shock domain-containing protein [Bacteroidetes bacterium]|nr:cold shock domain-containing protein [Bacteroidota bacterium]
MARSQETQNKKEKESKKLKKRKEKDEKKAERKAGGKKSFEDMIAYVDEFGNLTDTPPDPKKKKEINLEDIQLGAKIEVAPDPEDLIRKGNVSFFNEEKGYGFIRDEKSQESVFFHVNGLLSQVKEKDKVSFETEKGPKGLNAIKVTLVVG